MAVVFLSGGPNVAAGRSSRGPALEALLARVRDGGAQTRIVGLSATIANAGQVADWLRATLLPITWSQAHWPPRWPGPGCDCCGRSAGCGPRCTVRTAPVPNSWEWYSPASKSWHSEAGKGSPTKVMLPLVKSRWLERRIASWSLNGPLVPGCREELGGWWSSGPV
jgi:hypothetical protein